MISFILILLSAICNAIMDVCSFHYTDSIFSKLNPKWWDTAMSWKNKYVNWNGGDKRIRKLFWKINYPTFLTDSWHFFKSTMIVLMVGAIVVYNPVVCPLVDFAIMGVIWNVVFNLCYNKLFVLKK